MWRSVGHRFGYALSATLVLLSALDLLIGAYLVAAIGAAAGIVVGLVALFLRRADWHVGALDAYPPGPQGVVLVRRDGTRLPLELVYAGRDGSGYALWTNSTPIAVAPGDALEVEQMPVMTAIVGSWRGGPRMRLI